MIAAIFTIFVHERRVEIVTGAEYYQGKTIFLPQLCCMYRGIFPAAPVESAPMIIIHMHTVLSAMF